MTPLPVGSSPRTMFEACWPRRVKVASVHKRCATLLRRSRSDPGRNGGRASQSRRPMLRDSLGGFGLRSRNLKYPGDVVMKGYTVDDFTDCFAQTRVPRPMRHLPPATALLTATRAAMNSFSPLPRPPVAECKRASFARPARQVAR